MSFDVAWSPDCIDGRCYDAKALSEVVDFLVIMAYDEQSQMKTEDCIARANSPFNQTMHGKFSIPQLKMLNIKGKVESVSISGGVLPKGI